MAANDYFRLGRHLRKNNVTVSATLCVTVIGTLSW